ncbi:lariat debranching enzyme [Coemansia sp. RSA 2322]|uniref:Lariat debranching enzyme n=1 Tax=Coemansia thaxteri TaxID=2663907 RepID=A0A9W8BPB0_9FUNG|nr:lariat debranching enzyme [Coemansia thaxteri]KAJ2468385.1 lariat debranching enzyme [Coemansia sp. RSA 2322]KAJ2488116.1 lariat debranching enzyme [Coemansia sp. RSA 2320]
MSCPNKYKQIGGFYRYYTGERTAPIPTVFVGGNHEASNHMRELYYGGWVAPNIYYMGSSGVVKFGGLRIGGITGIFKDFDYAKGHYERPPFRGPERSSMHHVRSYEAFKMLQIRNSLDIVVSHDWPQFIERYGNTAELLRQKPFFEDEVKQGNLGSPVNAMLLEHLRPAWWFSAHMHLRFQAEVGAQDTIFAEGWAGIPPYSSSCRDQGPSRSGRGPTAASGHRNIANQDEIVMSALSDDDDEIAAVVASATSRPPLNLPPPKYGATEELSAESAECHGALATNSVSPEQEAGLAAHGGAFEKLAQTDAKSSDPRVPGRPTRFLALDKCLPRRQFLEIIEVEAPNAAPGEHLQLEYDAEWLAILRLCHPHMPLSELPFYPPADAVLSHGIPVLPDAMLAHEIDWVNTNVLNGARVFVPPNFVPVAPAPPPGTPDSASFGLAAQGQGMWGRGRGRGNERGRGRGHGRGGHAYSAQQHDVEWPGPHPHVIYPNPQTSELCQMLGIEDMLTQRQR